MSEEIEMVKIEDLVLDNEIYPRLQVRYETVQKYKEAMRAGSVFPPIIVAQYKGELYLLDGWHRVEASKRLGAEKMQAILLKPKSKEEMFKKAVEYNTEHGRTLSTQEKVEEWIEKKQKCEFAQVSIKTLKTLVEEPWRFGTQDRFEQEGIVLLAKRILRKENLLKWK